MPERSLAANVIPEDLLGFDNGAALILIVLIVSVIAIYLKENRK